MLCATEAVTLVWSATGLRRETRVQRCVRKLNSKRQKHKAANKTRLRCVGEEGFEEKQPQRKVLSDGSILFMFGESDVHKSKEEVIEELKEVQQSQLQSDETIKENKVSYDSEKSAEMQSRPIQEDKLSPTPDTGKPMALESSNPTYSDPKGMEKAKSDLKESPESNHSTPHWTLQELSHLRVEDLRQLCRERGIRKYSQLRKADLIEAMLNFK